MESILEIKVGEKNKCSIEGCAGNILAKRYCSMHYWRQYRHGTPFAITRRSIGKGTVNEGGYIVHGSGGIRKREHVLIVERILKKPIPKGAIIHHVNGNPADNRPQNLVVCPDDSYHRLLHQRAEALEKSGDPNKRRCTFCQQYDDVENLYIHGRLSRHRKCASTYDRKRYQLLQKGKK